VYVMALNDTQPREVLTEPIRARWFAWHPDGKQICYALWREGSYDWWSIPLDGGPPKKWERTPTAEDQFKSAGITSVGNFVWDPLGKSLYFEGLSHEVRNLWRFHVEAKASRLVAGPERLTLGAGQDTNPALSPDGQKLAFTIRMEN